jgi:hypothetical protein
MTFLLIIIAWLFVLSLVAGMCAVASAGDIEPLAQAPSPRYRPVWEQAEEREIYAHATGAQILPTEQASSLPHRRGVAA